MTNLRVWIDPDDAYRFSIMQDCSYSQSMTVSNYPLLKTDECYELVPVSKEQLAKEADEGIKQINEEMK